MCQLETNLRELTSVFVFVYAYCWFSHVAPNILCPYTMRVSQGSLGSGGGGAGRKKYQGQVKFYRTIERIVLYTNKKTGPRRM